MKASEFGGWVGALRDDDVVCCSDCKQWTPLADWIDSYVGCEDCGEHTATVCPECDTQYDVIFAGYCPPFTVRRHRVDELRNAAGLEDDTPSAIVADWYDDAGKDEEAAFLRGTA